VTASARYDVTVTSVRHQAVDLMLGSVFIGQHFKDVRDAQQQLLCLLIPDYLYTQHTRTLQQALKQSQLLQVTCRLQ